MAKYKVKSHQLIWGWGTELVPLNKEQFAPKGTKLGELCILKSDVEKLESIGWVEKMKN